MDPTVLGGHLVDHLARPVATSVGHDERRQPAVAQASDAAQLGGSDAAEPDVGRLLERLRAAPSGPRSGSGGRRGRRRPPATAAGSAAGPRRTTRPARSRATPKACCSCGSATPRPKAGSRRPPERRSRRGQLLGQHDRVAAGQHQDAGAELQLWSCVRRRRPCPRSGRGPRRRGARRARGCRSGAASRASTASAKRSSLSLVRVPRP